MKKITLNNALDEAYLEEMQRCEDVILFGEDVQTGCGATSHPILNQNFGDDRLIPMPITEQLICNSAVGMALAGMRPIAELGFEDFLSLGFDALVNQAAKIRFWSHGKVKCPLVVVTTGGVGAGCGCNHSQKAEGWISNVPGLKILCPTTAADTKGMMKAAIRDDDPVLFLVNRSLQYVEDEIPEGEYVVELGKARIAREGADVTVVCWHRPYVYTMELAEELAAEGISLEVIDPRSMCPFDKKTIIESVKKTGRLVVTHEAPYKFGPCAEIITSVVEEAMDSLKAAPVRACTPMTAIPSLSPEMETVVTKDQIKAAILKVMGR